MLTKVFQAEENKTMLLPVREKESNFNEENY